MCVGYGWGLECVQGPRMKHHYHIKDTLGFSVLMVITLPTIGAHCSDHNKKHFFCCKKNKIKGMEGYRIEEGYGWV